MMESQGKGKQTKVGESRNQEGNVRAEADAEVAV